MTDSTHTKRYFQEVAAILVRGLRLTILVVPAVLMVVVIRAGRPWILIRVGPLFSSRLGHFATNTELYVCELDAGINVPARQFVDLLYFDGRVANAQLALMWRRCLHVWPAWLLSPTLKLNRLLPGASAHEIPGSMYGDRDPFDLLEQLPAHLSFTADEERRGRAELKEVGIPNDAEFICLNVRDSSYLKSISPDGNRGYYDYHDYRDSDAQDCALAAEALADLGYYVIRMGAVVQKPLTSNHPRVIDYAMNGTRSEFMDVYLGAKCMFCLSTSAGFDAIPTIFRRPVAYVNVVPVAFLCSSRKRSISIFKHHRLAAERHVLSLGDIVRGGLAFCLEASCFKTHGVELVDNTPEEIRDVAIEMAEQLRGTWSGEVDDERLQERFREVYETELRNVSPAWLPSGSLRSRYSARFLREHPEWLQ